MADQPVQGNLLSRWQTMSAVQKGAVVLLLIAFVASVYLLFNWLKTVNYAPLFTGLDPKEAGTITESLKQMKIPYILKDQGTTIEVPKSKVHEARIQLATSGAIGVDGPGFELFDKTRFGVTEFEQKVDYQRALQEELRRTIVQLVEVEQARVHLVIPEKSVFSDEEAEAKASIVVKLKPGAGLSRQQVEGIVALATGSVEGLHSENVHVVDARGRVLNGDMAADELTGAALAQHEATRTFERECEKKVHSVLERVLGVGKFVVQVTAELDFDRQELVSNIPSENSAVLTEHNSRETGSGGRAGGIPETENSLSQVPTYNTGQGAGSSYEREESSKTYQVGTVHETTVKAPGAVKRISAAIVVDDTVAPGRQQQIQQVVAAALGLDEQRGDQVMVSSLAFEPGAEEDLEPAPEPATQKNRWLLYVAAGGGALLLAIIGFVAMSVLRGRKVPAKQPAVQEVTPVMIGQLDGQKQSGKDPSPIRELAKQKPEQVAEIIKVWLTTDQGR
ncbi:flagellar basal-body MS-ring/collar protein FliF [Desulforudis sp. DRI-14]|uniref:flagellar basal-body MS-ring/collar protein FliF n=1 Tax=Desulforudis sp. DRI-14 TaxID=3459793 RepID=UPI004041E357